MRSRDEVPNKVKLHPCRVLGSEEAHQYVRKQSRGRERLGNYHNVIQCFSFPNIANGDYLVVKDSLLIPFEHNINGVEKLNEEVINCYLRQQINEGRSKNCIEAERIFLKRVYDHAVKSETDYNAQMLKERREYYDDTPNISYASDNEQSSGFDCFEQSNSEKDGEQSDSDMGELEVPYTQAITFDPDDFPKITETCNEPLRVGDEVEYYCPMFVAGDKRGLRQASVISVDPKDEIPLVLSNGECLPSDIKVKRVRVISHGELIDHPGVFRPIKKFKLIKTNRNAKVNAAAGVMKEAARFGDIMNRNVAKMRTLAQAEGFAPMDLLVKVKGKKQPPPSPDTPNPPKKQPSATKPPTKKIDLSYSLSLSSDSSIDDIMGLSDLPRKNLTLATNINSAKKGENNCNIPLDGNKMQPKIHKRNSFSSDDSSIDLVPTWNLANNSLAITDSNGIETRKITLELSRKTNTSVSSDEDSATGKNSPEIYRARNINKTQLNELNPAKKDPKRVSSLRSMTGYKNKKTQRNQNDEKLNNQYNGQKEYKFKASGNVKPRKKDRRRRKASESSSSTVQNVDPNAPSEKKLSISSESSLSTSSYNLLGSAFKKRKTKNKRSEFLPNNSVSSTNSAKLSCSSDSDISTSKKEKRKFHSRRQEQSDESSSEEDHLYNSNVSSVKGKCLDSFDITESKPFASHGFEPIRARNSNSTPTLSKAPQRRNEGRSANVEWMKKKTARMRATKNNHLVSSTLNLKKKRRELSDVSSSDGDNEHSCVEKGKSTNSFSRTESNRGDANGFSERDQLRRTQLSSKSSRESKERREGQLATTGGWMHCRGGWERPKNNPSIFPLAISRKKK